MSGYRNATVSSVYIGLEGHGILTLYLSIDYGDSSGQSFGGYGMGHSGSLLGVWVDRLLRVFGVEDFAAIKDKPCRVELRDGRISRIGHFVKEEWFDPSKIETAVIG